jgi:hypothetical protein
MLHLEHIPDPLLEKKRKTVEIYFKDYYIYNDGNKYILHGNAFGEVFPAKELLETTYYLSKEQEIFNINPRGLNKNKSIVDQIVTGLIESPERFHLRSRSPIILWACIEKVEQFEFGIKVTLSFTNLQGCADGQHRLYSIQKVKELPIPQSLVDLRIPISIEINSQLDKTDYRNSEDILLTSDTSRHDWATRCNTLGLFDEFRNYIPEDWTVRYYDEQPFTSPYPRCHISHILKLLAMLDYEKFNWLAKNKCHPNTYISNVSGSHMAIVESASKFIHLIEDVIRLEEYFYECVDDYLSRSSKIVPGLKGNKYGKIDSSKLVHLPNKKIFNVVASENLVFPIISAFRVYLDDFYWTKDFDQFAFPVMERLWRDCREYLEECGERTNNPVTLFLREQDYWRKFCAEAEESKNIIKTFRQKTAS